MKTAANQIDLTVSKLAELYGQSFGGKKSGRYRVPQKLLRDMMGRRRLYPKDIRAITQALFERGFVMIDMESFYVILSANAFVNYRRLNQETVS